MAKVLKAKLVIDDQIIIEPDPVEKQTAGGIFIPDTAQEIPVRGTVVGVGFGTFYVKMVVNVGDRVLYPKRVGILMPIEGNMFLVMRQGDLICVI